MSRRPNFTEREVEVLLQGVIARRAVVWGRHSNSVTEKTKDEAWEAITQEVNCVSKANRTQTELKRKLSTFVSESRLKQKRLREQRERTGASADDVTQPELTPNELLALDLAGPISRDGIPNGASTNQQFLFETLEASRQRATPPSSCRMAGLSANAAFGRDPIPSPSTSRTPPVRPRGAPSAAATQSAYNDDFGLAQPNRNQPTSASETESFRSFRSRRSSRAAASDQGRSQGASSAMPLPPLVRHSFVSGESSDTDALIRPTQKERNNWKAIVTPMTQSVAGAGGDGDGDDGNGHDQVFEDNDSNSGRRSFRRKRPYDGNPKKGKRNKVSNNNPRESMQHCVLDEIREIRQEFRVLTDLIRPISRYYAGKYAEDMRVVE